MPRSPYHFKKRRDARRGLLLLDAVLSAIVIATALVFITRSLSGQLRTLHTLEEAETVAALGQGKLMELETGVRLNPRRVPQQITDADLGPLYGEQAATYRWSVHATPMENPESKFLPSGEKALELNRVTLTVQRPNNGPVLLTLEAIWPESMVPTSWH